VGVRSCGGGGGMEMKGERERAQWCCRNGGVVRSNIGGGFGFGFRGGGMLEGRRDEEGKGVFRKIGDEDTRARGEMK